VSDDVFYFGCWGEAGHQLFGPRGRRTYREEPVVAYYGPRHMHLDGTLAPRKDRRTGAITWTGAGDRDRRIESWSDELPQGHFLRHELDNGFTAIQWWDRSQGDKRGACNSTILMRGQHTSAELLAALAEHFPSVLANLSAAGITLVEVTASE
jgi:hypothetical protein